MLLHQALGSSRLTGRSDTTGDIERRARQEECPPLLLLADARERLEVPHFADRHAPLREEPFVICDFPDLTLRRPSKIEA